MYKNLISAFGFLLIPSLVYGIGVPTSGIDWEASMISIQSFDAAHPTHEANFSCFGGGFSDLPISRSLQEMAFSNTSPGPENDSGLITGSSCFQQAGEYQLQISLVDNAGNIGTAESYLLTVRPAEADSLLTTIRPIAYEKETDNPAIGTLNGNTTDCTAERLVANAEDDCQLQVSLRDEFGNVVVVNRPLGRMAIPGRDINNRDLNTFADAEGVFIDGLRLNDSLNNPSFRTDNDGNFNFTVSALAPSIDIITSPIDAAFKLSQIIPRNTPFEFPIPAIADDGSTSGTTTVTKSADLQFEPWVKLFLSDNAPSGGSASAPNEPLYFLLGDTKVLYAFAGTMLDHFLPSGFDVFVKGFNRPVGLFFEDEDLTSGFGDIDGDTVPEGLRISLAGNATSRSEDFETILKSASGLSSDENVAFGSKIRHSYREGSSTKTVLYPGGNLGSSIGPDPAFPAVTLPVDSIPGGTPGTATALLVGADIEGKVLANQDVRAVNDANAKFVTVGGITAVDIREDVTRNAEVITRGSNSVNSPGSNINFNINSGWTGDVAYFEDATVTLTGASSPMVFDQGQKTIVIRDGNLFIPDDLIYGPGFDDSLGVILINSTVNNLDLGHIFVKNDVQRLVGTYYAEGSILSTDAITDPQHTDTIANRELTNMDDPNAPLGLQLLLEGTILTRNTLGGALLDPPFTPEGPTTEQDEAIKYDLHFVRRYVPPLDPVTLDPLPDSANNNCVKPDGATCDVNKHSFVIRADGRVRNLTPPGFDQLSGFSAQ